MTDTQRTQLFCDLRAAYEFANMRPEDTSRKAKIREIERWIAG